MVYFVGHFRPQDAREPTSMAALLHVVQNAISVKYCFVGNVKVGFASRLLSQVLFAPILQLIPALKAAKRDVLKFYAVITTKYLFSGCDCEDHTHFSFLWILKV